MILKSGLSVLQLFNTHKVLYFKEYFFVYNKFLLEILKILNDIQIMNVEYM